jgi:nucleotide-binding universal stress UspA family protein
MPESAIRTVLLPVDGTPRSRRTAERAVFMAKNFGARLVLVHVRPKVPDFIGEPYYQEALNRLLENVERILAPYREFVSKAGVRYEERILEGDPPSAIVAAAKAENADLIVMGTRGLTDLAGVVIGSVSHKVLHASPCMVLMVP